MKNCFPDKMVQWLTRQAMRVTRNIEAP
jgi:hypothetical protein